MVNHFAFEIKLTKNILEKYLCLCFNTDLIIRNKVTPLMLKKHLKIAENIEKLTRFSSEPHVDTVQKNANKLHSSSIVRNIASVTMKRLKVILRFAPLCLIWDVSPKNYVCIFSFKMTAVDELHWEW